MTLQRVQAGEQSLQRGPAPEIDDFTGIFAEGRAIVLGVVDIEADVGYVLVDRPLPGSHRMLCFAATYLSALDAASCMEPRSWRSRHRSGRSPLIYRSDTMLEGSCHCGAVRIQVARKPRRLTSCNCSICSRYNTLWAYYDRSQVTIKARQDAKASYCWGDRQLRFVRCATCGCVTHWEPVDWSNGGRMGVNMRNFDPATIDSVRVRRLDGADTWEFLD